MAWKQQISTNLYLNTVLYDNIILGKDIDNGTSGGQYKTLDGDVLYYDQLELNTVSFTVSRQKNIQRSLISGRTGSFKEYVNTGDFIIDIRAKLNEANDFPDDLLFTWKGLEKVPQSIGIESKILNGFLDISKVVIESFDFDSPVGIINEIDIRIVLISDSELDLSIFQL